MGFDGGFYRLILGALAVWRVTHLLVAEDGPWKILARLRRALGEGFWGGLLDCFYCLSLWVALPVTFLVAHGWPERALTWLALSAGAILLERATSREPAHPPALYLEDPPAGEVPSSETSGVPAPPNVSDGISGPPEPADSRLSSGDRS